MLMGKLPHGFLKILHQGEISAFNTLLSSGCMHANKHAHIH